MSHFITIVALLTFSTVLVGSHHDGHHHHHKPGKAHVHGVIKVNVAVSGKQAKVEIKGPAESFFGFEHEPKSAKEKEAVAKVEKMFREQPASLVSFSKGQPCQYDVGEFEPFEDDGHHSKGHKHDHAKKSKHYETHVVYRVTCKDTMGGGKLTVALGQSFKRVKKVDLVVLSGRKQKSKTIKKPSASIEI